jgi:cobalamin-dependent methionine synthase I
MGSVIIFERIAIDIPYPQIYNRLGYKKKTTELTVSKEKEIDLYIEEAVSFVALKGCMLRTIIDRNNGEDIILSQGISFSSRKLANFLRDCREALLIGATAGSGIMDAIKEKTNEDNLSAAVIYDATASEMADAALDWIMDYGNQQLRREGKKLLPRRFSAGYADFQLANQETFFRQLQMGKIGVNINSNFILLPEKSVTAITGICCETPISKARVEIGKL